MAAWVRARRAPAWAGPAAPSGSLPRTLAGVFVITLTEILIWILWVAITDGKIGWLALSAGAAFGVAAIVLFVLMQVQHSVEMAGLKGTVVTACLLVGLSIEHVIQGSQLRPDDER